MSCNDRVGGPVGVMRPFVPTQGHNTAQDDIVEALDHIARAISAIDHNLEILITKLDGDSVAVARLAASLEGKSERNTGLSRIATSDDAATGSYATNAVRDFIRAQVERRWSLDLSTLGSKNFSVLIRVEITGAGVINKAEVVENATFNAAAGRCRNFFLV